MVKLQEDLGLPSITDGEFRRDWWHIDFLAGFDGIELQREGDSYHGVQFKGVEATPPTMFVKRKLRRTKPSMVPHFQFLKSVVKKGTPKFTMPSPAMLHARGDRDSIRKTYPDQDEFWDDLTSCYREEIAELYKAAAATCRSTTPRSPCSATRTCKRASASWATIPRGTWRSTRRAVNDAIRDVPEDMTVAIHTCRGNFRSTWLAAGGYDYVAETAFSKHRRGRLLPRVRRRALGRLRAAALHSEGQTRGAGAGFFEGSRTGEPRRAQAAHRAGLEVRAAREPVPRRPQCGFSSTHHGNNLSVEQEKAKLKLCIDTAKEVWGSL